MHRDHSEGEKDPRAQERSPERFECRLGENAGRRTAANKTQISRMSVRFLCDELWMFAMHAVRGRCTG